MKYKRYGKNFRRPSEVNRKWTDCDTCGGLGYFETNQSKGHMGISSCNACKLFEDDLEAGGVSSGRGGENGGGSPAGGIYGITFIFYGNVVAGTGEAT